MSAMCMLRAPIFVRPATCRQQSERRARRLLTNATATSQQLRIMLNNFRLFACDQGCMRLLAVLSTACSAAARGRSTGVVGEEKEKK